MPVCGKGKVAIAVKLMAEFAYIFGSHERQMFIKKPKSLSTLAGE
jgi:hypothetical protein